MAENTNKYDELNWQEMQALMRLNGGNMEFGPIYQGEISSYTPTFRERIINYLASTFYGDTREGVDRAKKITQVAEFFPPVAAATYGYDTVRAAAEGRYSDAAMSALAAGAGIAGIPALRLLKRSDDVVSRMSPRAIAPESRNYVVVSPSGVRIGSFEERMPKSEADITYGYRSMSYDELQDAIDTGYLRPSPKGSKHGSGKGEKWFSGGDESGQFGRTWKGGNAAPVRVRVQSQNIPSKDAIRTEDLEILDPQTGEFIRLPDILALQRKASKAP